MDYDPILTAVAEKKNMKISDLLKLPFKKHKKINIFIKDCSWNMTYLHPIFGIN